MTARRPVVRRAEPFLFVGPAVLTLLLVGVYPTLTALYTSLTRLDVLTPEKNAFVGLDNYATVANDPRFWDSLAVQARYTAVGVVVEIILGVGIALLLHRSFLGKSVVRALVLAPMILAPVSVGLMWRLFFNADSGMVNYFTSLVGIPPIAWLGSSRTALWAVVAADVWQWTPFVVAIALAGLESLPSEPFEAAAIDGADRLQLFRYVTLPMLAPLLVLTATLRAMDSVRTLDLVFIMTFGGPGVSTQTTNFFVYLTGFFYFHLGLASAIGVLLTIIITVGASLFIRITRAQAEALA
jgi:multiple sugar transport system permease protein